MSQKWKKLIDGQMSNWSERFDELSGRNCGRKMWYDDKILFLKTKLTIVDRL